MIARKAKALARSRRGIAPPALKSSVVIVTAGPTVEDIDPVRFLSNRSTGRMGVALAAVAAKRGARVILIHGPLQVPLPRGIPALLTRSAREMYRSVMRLADHADVAILCAAVADFAPARKAPRKLKKGGRAELVLRLVRTPDILAALGARKRKPLLVGFAAETDDVARHAKDKLARKNCDMICANPVLEKGSGFAGRTNRVTIYRRDGNTRKLPLLGKTAVAGRILDEVEDLLSRKNRRRRP